MSNYNKFCDLPVASADQYCFIKVTLPFASATNKGWSIKSTCGSCCNEMLWSWDEQQNNQVHQDNFIRLPTLFARRWGERALFTLAQHLPDSYVGSINNLQVILDVNDQRSFHLAMNRCPTCRSVSLMKYRKGYPPEEREQSHLIDITTEFKSIFLPDQSLIPLLTQAAIKPLPSTWLKEEESQSNGLL